MPGLTDAFSVVDISFAVDGVGAFSAANKGWGVGGPSLKTPNEGPGAKLQKKINFEDFKS